MSTLPSPWPSQQHVSMRRHPMPSESSRRRAPLLRPSPSSDAAFPAPLCPLAHARAPPPDAVGIHSWSHPSPQPASAPSIKKKKGPTRSIKQQRPVFLHGSLKQRRHLYSQIAKKQKEIPTFGPAIRLASPQPDRGSSPVQSVTSPGLPSSLGSPIRETAL